MQQLYSGWARRVWSASTDLGSSLKKPKTSPCCASSCFYHVFRAFNLLLLTSKSASKLVLISLQLVCSLCTSRVLHCDLSIWWRSICFLRLTSKGKEAYVTILEQGFLTNNCERHWPYLYSPICQSGRNIREILQCP